MDFWRVWLPEGATYWIEIWIRWEKTQKTEKKEKEKRKEKKKTELRLKLPLLHLHNVLQFFVPIFFVFIWWGIVMCGATSISSEDYEEIEAKTCDFSENNYIVFILFDVV